LITVLLLAFNTLFAQNATLPVHADNNIKTAAGNHFAPWAKIDTKDITRTRHIWGKISTTEENKLFNADNSNSLLDALIKGVDEGKITAYSAKDNHFAMQFKQVLTKEEFSSQLVDIKTNHSKIIGYLIKEDSTFLSSGEAIVRVLGIAPMSKVTAENGTIEEMPMFWIYYPIARKYLAECPASNSSTWDDVFEHRYFHANLTENL